MKFKKPLFIADIGAEAQKALSNIEEKHQGFKGVDVFQGERNSCDKISLQ